MNTGKLNVELSDNLRIDVNEKTELKFWSREFNVSPMELVIAVKSAGVLVKDVEKFLKYSLAAVTE
ncbi:MAG: hypothetical protein JWN78_3135 [Bacteroidota bacterium]|nr:hypothetical protein [Bacteroidota bacterium]